MGGNVGSCLCFKLLPILDEFLLRNDKKGICQTRGYDPEATLTNKYCILERRCCADASTIVSFNT